MAGFRFKIEEKDLLVNIVKTAVVRFDEQTDAMLKRGDDPLLVVGATDWAVIDAASGVCSRSGHVNDGGHGPVDGISVFRHSHTGHKPVAQTSGNRSA